MSLLTDVYSGTHEIDLPQTLLTLRDSAVAQASPLVVTLPNNLNLITSYTSTEPQLVSHQKMVSKKRYRGISRTFIKLQVYENTNLPVLLLYHTILSPPVQADISII